MINFNNTFAHLTNDFYQPILPVGEFKPSLLYFNYPLAQELGLNISEYNDNTLAEYFSFNQKIPKSEPVAMVYAGHQFGHFVPQLGDGRAVLLGEFLANNKRYDLHLKGSGKTMYSRRGDGKSALGPSIRECLVSEAMHHLGVQTTRTLSVVRTGEMVLRDAIFPGGVTARVALSHIRVGSFEYFMAKNDLKNLKILADYAINRLYPNLLTSDKPYFNFWKMVFINNIKLVAKWMSYGFIHGVMNTDNMNISGETIDYGPCAFIDDYSNQKVFSSIDHGGRYAYSNQPQILFWNMARFAESLYPLLELEVTKVEILNGMQILQDQFTIEYNQLMNHKFGLLDYQINDELLVKRWLSFLEHYKLDFTLSYIDLERFLMGKTTFTTIEQYVEFKEIAASLLLRNSADILIENMALYNPMLIARNHQVERAIQAALIGDDAVFYKLLEMLRNPYKRTEKLEGYHLPPKENEVVQRTFCGT